MITPELINYIKGELAKGRTREDIRSTLAREGGWSDADLSEAFRTVLPMQNVTQSPSVGQVFVSPKISPKLLKIILIVIVVAGLGFAVWFYRTPLMSFWNLGIDKIVELYSSYFGPKKPVETVDTTSQNNIVIAPIVKTIKDCGTTDSPNLKNKSTYENNTVLNCLGDSALRCEDAKAIVQDDLFPGVFEIVKNENVGQNTCNFRLSYSADSTLVDITGKKLALQYISCPINIVKAIDESKNPLSFSSPSFDNLGKYASQIYFYGTLGLFVENNIDKNKIQNLGCSGSFIDVMIESYQKA